MRVLIWKLRYGKLALKIKNYIYWLAGGRPKNCQCQRGSKVKNCNFEGANSIGAHSLAVNCDFGFATVWGANSLIADVKIGRYSSVAERVAVVRGQHPTEKYVSTCNLFYSHRNTMTWRGFTYATEDLFDEYRWADDERKYAIVIGNDVWIGYGVTIMEGIHIGDGAVIAAATVVTKHVPSYAIVGGVPAKLIRYRFDKETVDFLLKHKWWEKSQTWLNEHSNLMCEIEKYIKYEKKGEQKSSGK